jgi:hypothetical protein
LVHEFLVHHVVPRVDHGADPAAAAFVDASLRFVERFNFVVDRHRAQLGAPATQR